MRENRSLSTQRKETEQTVGGGIFFSGDHGFRVEKAAIFASAHLINDVRLEIDVKRPRHVFAGRGLRKERAEPVRIMCLRCIFKAAIRLNKTC